MSKFLIDTDICIFLLKERYGIAEKIKEVGISNCSISEISIAELTYGAYKSANYERHIQDVTKISHLFSIIPIFNSFPLFAEEKVRLQGQGNLIPDFDLLIGATAVNQDMILISNNERHMSRIANLQIENWTKREFNQFA